MPITVPLRSSIGPPLLPGLAAASVCTSVAPPAVRRPLTMPRETLFCNVPSAEPMTMISCPGFSEWALPIGITTCDADGVATFRIAMSNAGAFDSTRAFTVVPSLRRSVT